MQHDRNTEIRDRIDRSVEALTMFEHSCFNLFGG